jgi:4-amino-4-deoxy-L-arabinose transferase-like glycosyltransferase
MKTPFDNQVAPGRDSAKKFTMLTVLVGVAILVLAFVFQGSRGIWQPDEGYYVGTAVTMIKNGDFLIPRIGQEIFLEKPPLLYWGIIAGVDLFGKSEFACRFFTALCFALTAVLTGLLAHDMFKSTLNGIIACFIYATMTIPFVAANFITPDTSLVLWTTLSILFFFKSLYAGRSGSNLFKMLMYIALGFGFLTKGPAVLIPCVGMFVYLILTKQFKKFFLTPWTILGVLLFVTVGLSWYVYVSLKIPGSAAYFFDNQIWGRLVTGKYRRNPGITKILIYVPVLLFGSLPWITIWLERKKYFKTTVMNKVWWKNLLQYPEKLFLVIMFFVPLLIISLASSRLAFYSLPLFPILAVATSRLWTNKIPPFMQDIKIKTFARQVIPALCWSLLLLFSRFALAHFYNTEKDARALWTEISPYIPNIRYQIATLDQRADGLLFYGAMEVENVTRKDNPYPTFSMPETVESEIAEIIQDNHIYIFIIEGENRFNKTFELLKTHFSNIKTVGLKYERWLIIIDPRKPS